MKPPRSAPAPARPVQRVVPPPTEGLAGSWSRFWFTPVDPVGLHVVRLLAGLLFLSWLLPFAGHLDSLFGMQGWFDQQAYADAARLPDAAGQPFGWTLLYLVGSDPQLLKAVYWFSIGVLVLFTLGLWTRLTAVMVWISIASFTTNPAIDYDGDVFLRLLAFYLMIGYVLLGQRDRSQSVLSRVLGSSATLLLGRSRGGVRPSLGAGLALRLLQVHFAIVMVTSGLHKLQSGEWWSGVAFWYPLYRPFETRLIDARTHASDAEAYLTVLSLGAYAVLFWQIGFPLFAWRPRWRPVVVGGAVLGWLGNALIFRLPLLGPATVICCLGFVTAEEWHRLFGLLRRLPGLGWLPAGPDGSPARRPEWAAIEKPEVRMPQSEAGPKSESIMSKSTGL